MSDSSIERLQKKINQPGGARNDIRRGVLHEKHTPTVPDDWEHNHSVEVPLQPRRERKHHRARNFLVFAAIFFAISVAISGLVIIRGANVVNPPTINVTGPVAIDAGDVLTLEIGVTNGNTVPLRNVDLLIDYPTGTRDPDNVALEQARLRRSFGDLASGARVTESVAAVLFGTEGVTRDIIITVEYRFDGSDAVFAKESQYTVQIGDAPLLLQVDAPTEVISGDTVTLMLDLISNTSGSNEDMIMVVEYPFGFTYESAEPSPSRDTNVWEIDELTAGDTFSVEITGTLEGQNEEERTFEVRAGIADNNTAGTIGSELLATQHSTRITRPFVSADLSLNGSSDSDVVVENNKRVSGIIKWFNTLPDPVADVAIELELTGNALDESQVDASAGFYNSVTNTIVWDASRDARLKLVESGESGEFRFTLNPRDIVRAGITQGTINAALRVTGVRSQVGTPVNFSLERTIKIATEAAIATRYVVVDGPTTPQAEVPTVYAVDLQASAATNDIRGARVTASLPTYMTWVGGESGTDYNAIRREITWDVGGIPAGSGYTRPPMTTPVTVQLVPSVSQVGAEPVLLTNITLSGTDSYTNESVVVQTSDLEILERVEN